MISDNGNPVLVEPHESHRFDVDRLDSWLADRLDGFGCGVRVRQYEGGQSNPTYLIESASRRVVLRKKPPGLLLPTAHQVEREYRILAALACAVVFCLTAALDAEDWPQRRGIDRAAVWT